MRDVELVLFDFGGVFTDSPFEAVARFGRELGAEPGQVEELMFGPYHQDTDHAWHRLERGEIPISEVIEAVGAAGRAVGLELNPVEILMNMGGGGLRSVLVERVERLRAAGLRTALVTNNVAEFRPHWRAMLPVDELFHDVIDSSEVGVRKPAPEIYRLALERLGGTPERTLFLDDYPANVSAAEALGIHTVLVEADLATALEALDALLDAHPARARQRSVKAAE